MSLQMIFVYITLVLAIGYLAKKFVLPKRLFTTKKPHSYGCGQDDCGCN